MTLANNFVERMADGKARAMNARNRGRATGGKAKLHAVYTPVAAESWDYTRGAAVSRWADVRSEAQEQFRFEVYPERYAI